jgi:hypothetical protein
MKCLSRSSFVANMKTCGTLILSVSDNLNSKHPCGTLVRCYSLPCRILGSGRHRDRGIRRIGIVRFPGGERCRTGQDLAAKLFLGTTGSKSILLCARNGCRPTGRRSSIHRTTNPTESEPACLLGLRGEVLPAMRDLKDKGGVPYAS